MQFEEYDIRIDLKYGPAQNGVPNPKPLYERKDSSTHWGAEISAGFKLSKHLGVTASYTYSPLEKFDAHLVSLGLRFSF
ncbi:MAG: hypothetical protein QM760_22875 [Nibricoccus sp.]